MADESKLALAVEAGDATRTFAELKARAHQLTDHLRRLGVEPECLAGAASPSSEVVAFQDRSCEASDAGGGRRDGAILALRRSFVCAPAALPVAGSGQDGPVPIASLDGVTGGALLHRRSRSGAPARAGTVFRRGTWAASTAADSRRTDHA